MNGAMSWAGPWMVGGEPLQFDWPWMVPGSVAAMVVVLLLRVWHHRRRRVRLARLGSAVPDATSRGIERGRTVCLALSVLLAAMALAGPRWGIDASRAVSRGVDVVLAVDASASMLSIDERPSRLERVKQEIRRLRALAPADRVALIAFAGRSYILTPLTTDDGAIDLFLENLDPSVVGQPGSAVARAIRQGVELLTASASDGADRALVILSDGEFFEPEADMLVEARRAVEQRVSVVTVGFGTASGGTIPVTEGSLTREKRDESGRVITTRYSPTQLASIASTAGGTFIPATASDKATAIRQALATLRRSTRVLDTRAGLVPRYAWLLGPALVLLLLEQLLAARGRRPASAAVVVQTAPALASTALALVALLLPLGCTSSGTDPLAQWETRDYAGLAAAARRRLANGDGASEVRYNLGTALVALDSVELAIEPFEQAEARSRAALGDPAADSLLARTRFNAGLAHLLRGRALQRAGQGDAAAGAAFDAALALYRSYLMERPDDAQAKWNYELALRRKPPESGGGGGGGGGGGDASADPPPGEIDPSQADALLNSAAREERAVQGRRPKAPRGTPPPGGKDW